MKCTSRIFILLILVVFSARNATSRDKADISDFVILTGIIDNHKLARNSQLEGLITIRISELPITSVEMALAAQRQYSVEYKNGDIFKLKIPVSVKTNYIQISFSLPDDGFKQELNSWVDNIYIINKGDSVHCHRDENFETFTGLGSEKFQCQRDIYSLKYNAPIEVFKLLKNESTFLKGLEIVDKKTDSVLNKQFNVINSYKGLIDEDLLNQIRLNCVGIKYFGTLRSFTSQFSNLKRSILLNSTYFKKIDSIAIFGDSTNLPLSSIYASVLSQKIKFEISGITDQTKGLGYYQKCYENISNKYKGILRDKLLAILILNGKEDGIKLLSNVLNKIEAPIYKEALSKILISRSRGRSFSKYTVTDLNGKISDLSKYNNKVVLLDFWYTGCAPCIQINKALKPIYDYFEKDTNVVFVSISIDADFGTWKKSVASGLYTHQSAKNYYTSGESKFHLILQENLINSYPRFYILKNGSLYNSVPQIPKSSKDASGISILLKTIEDSIYN